MSTDSLFRIPAEEVVRYVSISLDGEVLAVPEGVSVAAALVSSGVRDFRSSVVGASPRAPYCMMGICFECLVEIDGIPARQACLIPISAGMVVRRQRGAADLTLASDGEP